MSVRSVVGVTGNITQPSRTAALLSAILMEVCAVTKAQSTLIELVDIGPELFQSIAPGKFESFTASRISPRVRSVIREIEAADVLVVGTPVYKGSYTGALKHLFDMIPPQALSGKPVLLAATGGSPLHGLVTEHQLRPLISFFGAHTIPTAIYATDVDFEDYRLVSAEIAGRIARAAREIARFLSAAPKAVEADAAIYRRVAAQ